MDDSVNFVPEAVAAQNDSVIRVQPSTQQLNIADITTIEIHIDNITNLMAADIELRFDPNILQAQDANSNKDGIQIQPGNFLIPDFIVSNQIDNEVGVARYTVTQLPPNAPANGSGLLASITFQTVGEGSSQLTFTLTKLATGEGQQISVTAQSGQVIVGQVIASPTLTFTPTTEPDQATATPTSEHDADLPTATPPLEPTLTPTPPISTPSASPTLVPTLPTTDTPAPPPSIPPDATIGYCYRVQEGDTLYKLGQKFGISPYYINVVNDLYPPGLIVVHQILFIPEQYGHGPNVYIVEPGDTLSNIAERCHLPVTFLAPANHLDENAVLQDGQPLKIPIPPFPPPARFPYPFPIPRPVPPSHGSCDYVVQPGDTLYSISRRYGISPDTVARANNLDNPDYIYAGQCLTLTIN